MALPEPRLAAGVKVAVSVVLVGLAMALRVPVPRVAVTSLRSNPSGASENVKVRVAVWPVDSAAVLLLTVTVGARVSMLMAGDDPAKPGLPTASV